MVQALTMAIGKKGVSFFAEQLVSGIAVQQLKSLTPPNNTIDVGSFMVVGFGYSSSYSNFKIALTNGRLNNFSPAFSSATQTGGGDPAGSVFDLVLNANNFSATFDWRETYYVYSCYSGGDFPVCNGSNGDSTYTYTPGFGSLTVTVPCKFQYDASSNSYEIVAQAASATTGNVSANIPSKSAVNGQESDGCFKTKVSDSTQSTITSIDFATPINNVFSGLLRTIPGSGDLGDKIRFDFELASSGLAFPGSDGITIGVTGVAEYDGTAYDGPNPPTLPIPAVPTDADDHYLNVYVSDWSINGLNWAYFKAGKLNLTLDPSDLPNPSALKAQTYATYEPAFKQYGNVALQARITPQAAPVSSFQTVYIFTSEAMALLQKQVPASVYTLLQGFSGDAYTAANTLEQALAATGIDSQYFGTIETATKQNGMVANQTMTFELLVENGANPLPNLVFNVVRSDVMTDLTLGVTSSNAQSMQFSFANVSNTATFVSTTIPGFNKDAFGSFVWPVVGETAYATALNELGQTGVAIPIAQGFSFLLTDSVLSVQDGYVSISTQLEFKPEQLPSAIRQNVYVLRQRPDPLTGLPMTVVEAA
ncbi:hypothetical protein [Jiella sonneratiae]|uniref:Lipid-binding serum glycoprotein C-terminal domain-containing protein n=1 Tax=Jiella sonneratiae TaxID=2816856 RepID=A0ABS3IXM9_9HYPH|nr:hypothetical protein [Jiella sonneratiae]MBO0902173.1 hypothetical protein [Jiella sonneratiae]